MFSLILLTLGSLPLVFYFRAMRPKRQKRFWGLVTAICIVFGLIAMLYVVDICISFMAGSLVSQKTGEIVPAISLLVRLPLYFLYAALVAGFMLMDWLTTKRKKPENPAETAPEDDAQLEFNFQPA